MNEKTTEAKAPVVAIIGRPNVGKSTLFNRLIGRRRAITDPTPGVTRDLLRETWILGGREVSLIDSGGIKAKPDAIDDLVRKKSLSLLEEADAILLLLDCSVVTPEDEILMQEMRPYADKIVLVVNKVDNPSRENLVWNCFSYGYQRVVGISSLHGLGIGDLEETVAGMLWRDGGPEEASDVWAGESDAASEAIEDREAGASAEAEDSGQGAAAMAGTGRKALRLAVMGKPNTGKSTLVNLLAGEDLSLVSDIPGTTRDVVSGGFSFKNVDFTIIDTAGIRRKSKVGENVEYYSVNRAIKTIDYCDVALLMIDVNEGLSDQDKKIAGLIVRRGRGIVLVLNKIDLLSGIKNEFEAIVDRLRFLFPVLGFAPVVGLSALTGANIDKVLKTVLDVWRQLNKRIPTAEFNAALSSWSEDYRPPRGAKGQYKLMYGTQISVNPVRFLIFCNRIKGFPETWLSHIKNRIRQDLGFKDIPVDVVLRERSRSESKSALGPKPRPRPGWPESGSKPFSDARLGQGQDQASPSGPRAVRSPASPTGKPRAVKSPASSAGKPRAGRNPASPARRQGGGRAVAKPKPRKPGAKQRSAGRKRRG